MSNDFLVNMPGFAGRIQLTRENVRCAGWSSGPWPERSIRPRSMSGSVRPQAVSRRKRQIAVARETRYAFCLDAAGNHAGWADGG